jgi:hypothetical protein
MTSDAERKRFEEKFVRWASWLDERFRIPGTRWRFGLDGLLGLIPVAGDTATAALAAYLVFEAKRLGVPNRILSRMVANILIDLAVGSVPVVGDVFDVGWKANSRNLKILKEYLRLHEEPAVK